MDQSTLQFLKDLKNNNNKEWMDANKKRYESAKNDFEVFVSDMIKSLAKMDSSLSSLIPKQCIFRLNRDIRFSNDKSPYKTNFGAVFSASGKKHLGAGYYFHLQPGGTFAGGGIWQPDADGLKMIRQEIDYNFKDFEKIVKGKNFNDMFGGIDGDKLVRPPKGYDESNPAIEYIKLKSFTVGRAVSDKEIVKDNIVQIATGVYKTMKPFNDFLDRAIS